MRALVTGATGFIGGKLALRLAGMGWQVTAAGRNAQQGRKIALAAEGITYIRADLQDEASIMKACEGQDYVFHCGALSSPWGKYDDFYQSNVIGTRNVAGGCLEHKVKRLIHVSTPSIYFDYTDRLNIKEDDPLPARSVNFYAATKLLAETEVDRAYERGLETITIRPRGVFGPGDQAILPRLLKANERGKVPLINGGQAKIDITYVENVVDSLLLCAEAGPDALGRKYNITNGEPVMLAELLENLFYVLRQPLRAKPLPFRAVYWLAGGLEWGAKLFAGGKEPLITRYTVGVLGTNQTLDITRARVELGYEPKVTISDGILKFADWWRKGTDD
ncbi:NAD(P)-dependent oxidoreductase [Paenibacillus sp. J2TS4]|uniref:NAD-dependent epimerase/dehydratase family protein n=1 Tax=Paenibacillus sp. J2TS4 TaxID=2807194 RepID=UPI001B1A7D02|nr:NAD-dependent epimerase/dehydratase family protein [Paenibacillus sp. J2TS4]GIP35765.1 3-beta hydroxysteroid dehydrogenase [Paenibacillus sp. J2TS4]